MPLPPLRLFPRAIQRRATGLWYPHACRRLMSGAGDDATPRSVFAEASDGLWLWANSKGLRSDPALASLLPGLPDEQVQRKFTSRAGDATLRDGFRFYRLVKESGDRHHAGGWQACRDIVDYGCGWGRTVRFFVKDRDPNQLTGIDVKPEIIESCRSTNRYARFEVTPPFPPSPLEQESADLVYAHSVLSHLSEEAQLAMLDEIHRLLRPGGVAVLTTRPRRFIAYVAEVRSRAGQRGGPPTRAFVDTHAWHERYDRGEFCYDPVNPEAPLGAFYGETAIPLAYVERVWTRWFTIAEYISDPVREAQDVFVVVKPAGR